MSLIIKTGEVRTEVRDWYVPHPLFSNCYLKLEEIFKSQSKMSLIIHYQPHNDFGEVRTES